MQHPHDLDEQQLFSVIEYMSGGSIENRKYSTLLCIHVPITGLWHTPFESVTTRERLIWATDTAEVMRS